MRSAVALSVVVSLGVGGAACGDPDDTHSGTGPRPGDTGALRSPTTPTTGTVFPGEPGGPESTAPDRRPPERPADLEGMLMSLSGTAPPDLDCFPVDPDATAVPPTTTPEQASVCPDPGDDVVATLGVDRTAVVVTGATGLRSCGPDDDYEPVGLAEVVDLLDGHGGTYTTFVWVAASTGEDPPVTVRAEWVDVGSCG